ncbi:hypothetical protein EXU85_04085 [Spirosoma sp. KCTC 42546]|uniref:hypothetical protein n=1 Tax=Spirosoma sp. KCTC 42546 TaxID=2520506 RepID=UPI001159C0D1|nr:hypothetical protein [Spirosoma sp. KCTC 42546]QDK77814.1 hypothetical protein EXU85_04085 [Spirosoma sp. KCTC 42546]
MLTPAQLTAIDNHLRKENWLLNNDLIAELTDHYAVGIEDRLDKGMAFDTAILELHSGFGGRKGLLKMEEEYQRQKALQLSLMEWQLIRSFMYGSRWFIGLGAFIVLIILNIYLGQQETVESALGAGFLFVTSSVFGNLLRSIIFFYQNRNEVNAASLQPNSTLYISAYILSLSLLLANKYLFPTYSLGLSSNSILLLNTLLETLCLIYYIAIAIALRQFLLNGRKKRIKI